MTLGYCDLIAWIADSISSIVIEGLWSYPLNVEWLLLSSFSEMASIED